MVNYSRQTSCRVFDATDAFQLQLECYCRFSYCLSLLLFLFQGCGQWSEWSKCDKDCIGGKMSRYRNCTKAYLVRTFEVETKSCNNTQPCDAGELLKFNAFILNFIISISGEVQTSISD